MSFDSIPAAQIDLPVVPIGRSLGGRAVVQIRSRIPAIPRPSQEGRFAIVTNVGRGERWTLWLANDERMLKADGEVIGLLRLSVPASSVMPSVTDTGADVARREIE